MSLAFDTTTSAVASCGGASEVLVASALSYILRGNIIGPPAKASRNWCKTSAVSGGCTVP